MAFDVRNANGILAVRRLGFDVKLAPQEPVKCIIDMATTKTFGSTYAYTDIVGFICQLSRSMIPSVLPDGQVRTWQTQSLHIIQSPSVMRIKVLIQTLRTLLRETPPETGPRRFGNAAFRTWYKKVEEKLPQFLQLALPESVWKHVDPHQHEALKKELGEYFLGGLGSPERLDYGTGHELSFLAFLIGIWKLNGFAPSQSGCEERGIVVGILEPYFDLMRSVIKQYSLEPAGSHGVWGLDDHFFLPFILGSAQFAPPLMAGAFVPSEGSLPGAPLPKSVVDEQSVRAYAPQNLYFCAIAFIYAVKKGPFWEHSPMLYDISGIEAGWAKINKGLIKMYLVEVLSKFPVIQHLRFGSLLRWEVDKNAPELDVPPLVQARAAPPQQPPTSMPPPKSASSSAATTPTIATPRPAPAAAATRAPWAMSQRPLSPPRASPPRFQPSSPTGSFVVPNLSPRRRGLNSPERAQRDPEP